jgi:hypothetical protein
MAKLMKGQAFTYGTKNDGSYITLDIGTDQVIQMYATEIRLSMESDSNTANNANGETISACYYNQRKVLNLTGMIAGSTASPPNNIQAVDAVFGIVFQAGENLDITNSNWPEIEGNYIVQSAEKTRSNGNYAEWSITAIEYIAQGISNADVPLTP